jgi:hypothetical protein
MIRGGMPSPRDDLARRETSLRDPLWVESDEHKEAARALEMLHVQLVSAVIDPYAWKWVIMALHHAVRAFLAASLDIREGPGPTPAPAADPALVVAYPGSGAMAEAMPPDLPELYDRMKNVTGFRPPEEVDQEVARLGQYRDALFQRVPTRWSLRINELPHMTRSCLRVVEYLGWNPGHIGWQKENLVDLARVKYLASMKVAEALAAQYHASA